MMVLLVMCLMMRLVLVGGVRFWGVVIMMGVLIVGLRSVGVCFGRGLGRGVLLMVC